MIDLDDYMKYGIVHDEDEDNYDDYNDNDDELDRLLNDDEETNDNDEENDSEDYLYDDSNVKSRSNSNEYRPMKSDRKTVKTEIVFDPYDYVDDDTEELYYTKMLLDNFPELKNEFSIDNWNVPLFMIKDLTERQDFDSALKYFQFLVDNVDYDYLFKKKRETADRLSIEIY